MIHDVDYLRLVSGKTSSIPFDAFLRRVRYEHFVDFSCSPGNSAKLQQT